MLAVQGVPFEARVWLYALMGRCFYPLNTHDHWQVVPFIRGTGGSVVSWTFKQIFGPSDLRAVSGGDIERKFGVAALYGGYLWMCTEVAGNVGLSQGQFSSLAKGERTSILRKYGAPETVDWTAPGLLCGTTDAPWKEMGSASRHLVVWEFLRRTIPDCELCAAIRAELPVLVFKANAVYRWMAQLHQGNIWSVLPDYFQQTRSRMQGAVSMAAAFIEENEGVALRPGCWMAYSTFKARYAQFMRTSSHRRSSDEDVDVLLESGLRIVSTELPVVEGGPLVKNVFVVGFCKREDLGWQASYLSERAHRAEEGNVNI
mgnify:CR=1 FL=1